MNLEITLSPKSVESIKLLVRQAVQDALKVKEVEEYEMEQRKEFPDTPVVPTIDGGISLSELRDLMRQALEKNGADSRKVCIRILAESHATSLSTLDKLQYPVVYDKLKEIC